MNELEANNILICEEQRWLVKAMEISRIYNHQLLIQMMQSMNDQFVELKQMKHNSPTLENFARSSQAITTMENDD